VRLWARLSLARELGPVEGWLEVALFSYLCPRSLAHRYRAAVLIVESTYGTQTHEPRLERERRFAGLGCA